MAQKASKAQARANIEALKNLRIGALAVNFVFLTWHFVVGPRSLTLYFALSLPALFCHFTLEKTGRPSFNPNGTVISAGFDLNQPGVTEYMFDCIWITWASVLLVILIGNWGWLLYSVVPAFALYKGAALLQMAKGMAGGLTGMPQASSMEMNVQPAGSRKQRRRA